MNPISKMMMNIMKLNKIPNIPKKNEYNKFSKLLFSTCLFYFMFNSNVNFLISAASYHSKYLNCLTAKIREKFRQELFTGVFSLPHPAKAYKGGEDSYLVENELLAVADGVGGWNERGIDPALYSKELCKHLRDSFYDRLGNDKSISMNETVLKQLIVESDNKNKNIIGSSTLCSAFIDNKLNMLYTAYIGDSLYMILKKYQEKYLVFYKSPEMTHGFNFPLQLGTNGDNPLQSNTFKHELDKEDIVILASDGLWDNLHDHEVENIVNSEITSNKSSSNKELVDTIAKKLATRAGDNSKNKNFDSPFALRAREYKHNFHGGKLDDITVIVTLIKECKNEIDNALTRDNSTTDLIENEHSDRVNNKNIEDALNKLRMNEEDNKTGILDDSSQIEIKKESL